MLNLKIKQANSSILVTACHHFSYLIPCMHFPSEYYEYHFQEPYNLSVLKMVCIYPPVTLFSAKVPWPLYSGYNSDVIFGRNLTHNAYCLDPWKSP